MSNPIEELGKVLESQIQNVAKGNKGITIELGKITGNMGLSVDSLSNTIPKGDYMVSLRLTAKSLVLNTSEIALTAEETQDHEHLILRHGHTVTLPTQMRGIKPGDRVLVAWVGTEPVVIDILVSS